MKTFVRPLALLTLSIAVSTAAFGAPASGKLNAIPSKTVSYADLDLSKAAGAETLYNRIRSAARFVCRGLTELEAGRCRQAAIEAAVKDVGIPKLTVTHRAATEGTSTSEAIAKR